MIRLLLALLLFAAQVAGGSVRTAADGNAEAVAAVAAFCGGGAPVRPKKGPLRPALPAVSLCDASAAEALLAPPAAPRVPTPGLRTGARLVASQAPALRAVRRASPFPRGPPVSV